MMTNTSLRGINHKTMLKQSIFRSDAFEEERHKGNRGYRRSDTNSKHFALLLDQSALAAFLAHCAHNSSLELTAARIGCIRTVFIYKTLFNKERMCQVKQDGNVMLR